MIYFSKIFRNNSLWKPQQITGRITFTLRNKMFQAKMTHLNKKDFISLGLNPKYFRPGIKIYLLDKDNFSRFCQVCGTDLEVGGFYPLSKRNEEKRVALGELDYLSDDSRTMVLPENSISNQTLVHEVLHDIFIGGGIKKSERDIFVRNLFIWIFHAQNDPQRTDELNFYNKVAESCKTKLRLKVNGENIKELIEGAKLDHKSMTFIGECFAYAGEIYLGYTKEWKLPREIKYFFEKVVNIKNS